MNIKIRLTKEEVEHLSSPHSFSDECGIACDVLFKVQKQIDKRNKTKVSR